METPWEGPALKYEELPDAFKPYWELDKCDEARLMAEALGHRIMSHTIWPTLSEYIVVPVRDEYIRGCAIYIGAVRVDKDWLTREKVHDPAAGPGHS